MHANRSLLGLGATSIGVNIALMLVKVTVGLVGNSFALIADGIESASDILSSFITWAGFQFSLRPPDRGHPYGHGKVESLAGMFSGACLLGAAAAIAYGSIREIHEPHASPAWYTLPVLVLVVVVKEWLSRRVLSAGNAVDSQALRGDGWHHRSDAITSAAAAIGITIALVGGKRFTTADEWAALIACVIILINGVIIFRAALHDILDGSTAESLTRSVTVKAQSVTGVTGIEKCRIRKSGIGLFVEMHVQVDPATTVLAGHETGHRVKDALIAWDSRILDVVVHLEPATPLKAG